MFIFSKKKKKKKEALKQLYNKSLRRLPSKYREVSIMLKALQCVNSQILNALMTFNVNELYPS